MIKPSPWNSKRLGYKRIRVGPNQIADPSSRLTNKLPKIFLSGPLSNSDAPVSQRDHAETHERIFADRNDWLKPTIRGKLT